MERNVPDTFEGYYTILLPSSEYSVNVIGRLVLSSGNQLFVVFTIALKLGGVI